MLQQASGAQRRDLLHYTIAFAELGLNGAGKGTLFSLITRPYAIQRGRIRIFGRAPMPRWFLLSSKLVAGMPVSLPQVYTFLAIAWFWEIEAPPFGYIAVLPALVLSGLMSSVSKQLENFDPPSIRCGA